MSAEYQQFVAGIASLEAQRGLLGDAVVDAAIAALRSKLVGLTTATAAEPTQTLRQVSILFLDVVGSTTLSQRLDPEDIHAVMDGALERFTAVVLAHHGKVLQYAGDSLLAVFGATGAKEDDAERAVRCGLALLVLGQAFGAEVHAAYGHSGFDVRVGVHTGGVLLGGGVDADGTIRGSAVNIAARMEQTAPAGVLRISHDTYAQVRGIFDVEPQDPIAVKGVDTPIQTYLVQRAKPRAFRIATRGIEGVPTQMIGRDAELEALQRAFKHLFVERKLAAVTVVAEAGVGKSRLLTEFEAWSEARPESFFIFRGRANPSSQSQPYGLLRDALAWRLQIADDDTLEAAKAKLEQGIVPLFVQDEGEDQAESHAHLLGHLLGIDYSASRHIRGIRDDPRQIRNRAFHAAAQVFRRVSASDGSPIVLQLEDLHWADDASLDFLTYLTQVNRDVPVLIVALARPTLYDRRADWMSTEGIHLRIDLAPLDKTGSRLLANELLKKLPEVPAGLRELITGGSEGNPFYMEELVKMLIDQGAIETGGPHSERWTLHADKLLGDTVPHTLTGVLQARLDALPAAERLALQQASVIGAVFWDRALIALDARAEQALPALVRRELALPHAGAVLEDGVREYAFRHQILHQVTYDTVLKRTRRELHDKVARWLAGLTGLHASEFLGIAADHYERAGDTANAVEYHTRAAEHAQSRFAHHAALDHAQRALALLGLPGQHEPQALGKHDDTLKMRWRLSDVRERILDLQARRVEQRAVIDDMSALADALDDGGRRAYAAFRLSGIAQFTDGFSVSASAARQSMILAERVGDDMLRLSAIARLAYAMAAGHDWEPVKALAQQGLAESREKGLRLNEAKLLSSLAVIAFREGDRMGVLELRRLCLSIQREIGDRGGEALALANLGWAWLWLGALESGRSDMEEALRLYRANGDRSGECMSLVNLSAIVRLQGDDARALSLARAGLELAVATEMRHWHTDALIELGEAELGLGRHAPAAQAFEQARAQASVDRHRHGAAAGLARTALAQGDAAAALQEVEQLVEKAAADGAAGFGRDIELTCHLVLASAGDARAAEWLQVAHARLQGEAATITDAALRRGFLANIPEHREIEAAWAAWQRSSGGATGVG
jgi:class 3 adenylate cyclase/tetratricopeptide (TPR) repeat protein